LPHEEIDDGLYRTLSGFILHRLGHVPREGERFTSAAHELEITDTDRQRIDKLTGRRLPPPEASGWIRRAGGSARA
jgi:hypothetical protein